VLAVALGLIRSLTNTTTSAICHVAYNALVGVALVQTWAALPGIAVEAALVAAAAGTWFFTTRVGNAPATG